MPSLPAPTLLSPYASHPTSWPCKMMLVGEAWGQEEARLHKSFVGWSGQELTRMLRDAGINRSECYLTNLFHERPPDNDITAFCTDIKTARSIDPGYSLSPLQKGGYLHPQYLSNLERLAAEVEGVDPVVIVPLGGTALWALAGVSAITKHRGAVGPSSLCPGHKMVPTFHPASVLRSWHQRVIVVSDLIKARRECGFRDVRRPARRIRIATTVGDVRAFIDETDDALAREGAAALLTLDVETKNRQITDFGFALSPEDAFVIPLVDERNEDNSYWKAHEESDIWHCIDTLCRHRIPKLGQNGLYDIQMALRCHSWQIMNYEHDTMILHHALYPEMQKDLGFLGSIYTNETAWKLMRTRTQKTEKKDE